MRKLIRIILASSVCMLAASCLKDAFVESSTPITKESLIISTEEKTKTSLNGSDIYWSFDDVIAVFDNSNVKNSFTALSTDGNRAEFSGEVSKGTSMIYAVYPYELANSANGSTLNVTIPVEQASKAGSFAEEHNISVAKAEKAPGVETISGITFKNVCALLKFTVPSYISDVKKVTLSSNTVIAGDMSVDYSSESPVCTISSEGSKSISMTGSYPAGSTFWFVLAPVTLDGINVNVETSKGVYSMSSASQFPMTAGNYRNLGTLNLTPASIVNATAAHTYSNGTLTGTNVSVNLGIQETTAAYVTNLQLQVKNASGTVVRSLNKDVASSIEAIPADATWPYLPKGTYTVSGKYTLSGVTEKSLEPITFTIDESPVFDMTLADVYTSYSKYTPGNPSAANSLDGSTIYNVGATVNVSNAILNNSNYPSLSLTDNGTAVSAGNLASRSWGKHTIKASYTLDGVTISKEASVHVTGLPYTAAPPTKSGDHPWSENEEGALLHEISWNTDGVKLEGTSLKQVLTSPSFHIPSNIDVTMTVPVKFYSVCVGIIHAQPQLLCRIGGVEVDNRKGAKASTFSPNKSENYTSSKNGVLTSAYNTVEVENAYTMSTAYIYVYSVDVKYR